MVVKVCRAVTLTLAHLSLNVWLCAQCRWLHDPAHGQAGTCPLSGSCLMLCPAPAAAHRQALPHVDELLQVLVLLMLLMRLPLRALLLQRGS